MISEKSHKAYEAFKAARMDYVDYNHMDFAAATKANSEAIGQISDLSGLTISQVDAGGVKAEQILLPEADSGKYIYYIHGGGWTNGEPAWGHYCAVNIARLCKRNLLLVDYRYAPAVSYPVSHDDCFVAYKWMLDCGISAKDICFLGESTGGNLVLSTAVLAKERGIPLPAAICSISPVVDLSFSFPSYTERMERDVILPRNQNEIVKNLYVRGADTKDPVMSPIYADFTGFPPTYFEVSTEEMLFDDAIKTHEKMLRQGVDSRLKVWEGMWHTFYMMDFPESHESFALIARFFEEF